MTDPRAQLLAVVLIAWFVLSILHQPTRGAWTRPVRRHLPLGLIPTWTFFAPNPARDDLRLVWRDERNGVWGGWTEVVLPRSPVLRQGVLNPEAVSQKAVSDLVGMLSRSASGTDDLSWMLSTAYLALLGLVVNREREPGADAVQFAVLRTRWDGGARHVDVSFLSAEHCLDPVDAH